NFLSINNFRNRVTPYGIISASDNYPLDIDIKGVEYPQNTGINTLSFLNPWLANRSDDIIAVGEQYEGIGHELISGPLADIYDGDYLQKYFRTWNIYKTDIDRHITEYDQPEYIIPEVIKNWPAGMMEYNGSMYEQADFVDLNQNNLYEPERGEYPKISGDQAILYIVNNGRFPQANYHNYPTSDSLNIDMYVLVYAFDRPESDIFQNTFFMKYKVINKSDIDYEDFRFGQWLRINTNSNRYLGSDSLLNTFYFYPNSWYYSSYVDPDYTNHMECITFLNQKMDKLTSTDANTPYFGYIEKYNFMDGTWADTLVSGNFPPDWIDKAPLNYCYPSNPSDPLGWSQITDDYDYNKSKKGDSGNRGVGTSGPHFLGEGEKLEFELAFYINNSSDKGYFEFIDESLNNIEQLIECYQNDSIPGGGSFTQIPENSITPSSPIAQIYPNPAHTLLHIQTDYSDFDYYRIYSVYGQLVEERQFTKKIDIEHLQDGFYLIQLLNGNGDALVTRKFVKQ
ncbi:MAG: T9SS type A sorting domain-containing protein, partial [Bacteroidales bacterium]|nr:T9SS type A sorting domain-containing protein [Bacteroidales bacterium]